MHLKPCDVMYPKVEIDEYDSDNDKMQMQLAFVFASDTYLEFQNTKAYDDETLLGQVGGYIGTFNVKRFWR